MFVPMMQFSADSIAFRFKCRILEYPKFFRGYTTVTQPFALIGGLCTMVPSEILPRKFLNMSCSRKFKYFPAENLNWVSALLDKRGGPAGD